VSVSSVASAIEAGIAALPEHGDAGLIGRRGVWWSLVMLLCGALVFPMLLVDAPPLLDYLNHLARFFVLADGGGDPVLARMYAPHWAIIPDLALDVLAMPLVKVLPVLIAGKLAVCAIILLPVIGTMAYARATHGRLSYWSLGVGLVAYNMTVLLGFMNFLAGIGLAMLLAAAWIRWRDAYPARTVALCAIGAAALFFCHLMGVVLFLILTGAFELAAVWDRPRTVFPRAAAFAILPAAVGVLYLLSPLQAVSAETLWLSPGDKAVQLLAPVIGYDEVQDGLTAALLALTVLGLAAGRALRVPAHGAIAIVVLLALYAGAPFIMKGTCFLDTRFAIMLGYLLFGAVMPARLPRAAAATIAVAFAAVFAWRMTTIDAVWSSYQRDIDGMRAAIAEVQPGDRVYVTSVAPEEAPDYWRHAPQSRMLWTGLRLDYHLAALVLLERRAFWPFLFTDPAQQPIIVLPPYERLADSAGSMLAHDDPQAISREMLRGYDFLLLLNAGGEPDLAHYGGDRLRLLQEGEVAALYRVLPVRP
jgi:hypothetical protein